MRLKRDKIDIVFSQLIRERVGYRCEYSGKLYPEGHRQGLHCSHLWSRSQKSTRWHPQNAFSHGYGAHRYFEGRPAEFVEWARLKLGEEAFEKIRKLAQTPVSWRKHDLEDLYAHMKTEMEEMNRKRADGVVDRIEIAIWPGFEDITPAVLIRRGAA